MNRWDIIFDKNPKYKPLNEIFLLKLLRKIKKDTNSSPKTMIDLGCGTADTLFQFAKKGFDVTGIDFSKTAINKLKQKIKERKVKNIKLIQGDLNFYMIKESYDIYLCNFVYAFIDNKDLFLKNISQQMKENSVFILITPVSHKGIIYTKTDKTHIAVDFEKTADKLKKYFSKVNIYHHDYIGIREDYVTFLIKK